MPNVRRSDKTLPAPLKTPDYTGKGMIAFEPIGDSMKAPHYEAGRTIFYAEPCQAFRRDGLYLLRPDGEGPVVMYRVQGRANGLVRLLHDDPIYQADDVTRDWFDSAVIARCRYSVTALD